MSFQLEALKWLKFVSNSVKESKCVLVLWCKSEKTVSETCVLKGFKRTRMVMFSTFSVRLLFGCWVTIQYIIMTVSVSFHISPLSPTLSLLSFLLCQSLRGPAASGGLLFKPDVSDQDAVLGLLFQPPFSCLHPHWPQVNPCTRNSHQIMKGF